MLSPDTEKKRKREGESMAHQKTTKDEIICNSPQGITGNTKKKKRDGCKKDEIVCRTPERTKVIKGKSSSPDWNPQTSPLVIVSHFCNELSREDVKDKLKKHKIHNIKDLHKIFFAVFPELLCFDSNKISTFFKSIEKAMNRSQSAEEILNDKKIGLRVSDDLELKLVKDRYRDEAIVYDTKNFHRNNREEDIILVLGASGSGKTFFSVGCAAAQNKDMGKTDTEMEKLCIVYHKLSYGSGKDIPDNLIKGVKNALLEVIQTQNEEFQWDTDKKLDMCLSLVLDEAAGAGDQLNSLSELKKITSKLQKIAEHTRLIVAGTGYDEISSGITSDGSVQKCRMQPWTFKEFEIMVKGEMSNKRTRENLVNAIKNEKILCNMITNPRSAYLMFQAVRNFPKYLFNKQAQELNLKDEVGSIVNKSATDYICNNGLKDLDASEQFEIARAVFHEIHISSKEKTAAWPKFEILKTSGESTKSKKRHAMSLLTTHIEGEDGDVKFIDKEFRRSVTVSPAITTILFYMCGVDGNVMSGSWRNFEKVVGLYAFRTQIVNSEKDEKLERNKLFEMKSPVPHNAAINKISVPQLWPGAVWINGEMSSFADVVAPFALYQAKYTTSDSAKVNLVEELNKMGVLSFEAFESYSTEYLKGQEKKEKRMKMKRRYHIGRAIVSLLKETWDTDKDDEDRFKEYKDSFSRNSGEVETTETKNGDLEMEMCMMTNQNKPQIPFKDYSLKYDEENSMCTVRIDSTEKYKQKIENDKFAAGKELEVVFVTNAKEFELSNRLRNMKIESVSHHNVANKDVEDELSKLVRGNVKLCFRFGDKSE